MLGWSKPRPRPRGLSPAPCSAFQHTCGGCDLGCHTLGYHAGVHEAACSGCALGYHTLGYHTDVNVAACRGCDLGYHTLGYHAGVREAVCDECALWVPYLPPTLCSASQAYLLIQKAMRASSSLVGGGSCSHIRNRSLSRRTMAYDARPKSRCEPLSDGNLVPIVSRQGKLGLYFQRHTKHRAHDPSQGVRH